MKTFVKAFLKRMGLFEPARAGWLWLKRPEWWKRERDRRRFYAEFVQRGSLCFDIGANVGKYTADLLQLGARVVAVEPQAVCVNKLRRMYSGDRRVALVPAAVGASEGTVTMYTTDASAIGSCSKEWLDAVKSSGRFAGHDWNESVEVPMTTLDKLIAGQGQPAFCKIDVEGFELDVLRGLTTPIAVMSFEFSPETIDRTCDCVRYLARLARYRFNYCAHGHFSYALPEWLSAEQFERMMHALPADARKWGGDVYARVEGSQ